MIYTVDGKDKLVPLTWLSKLGSIYQFIHIGLKTRLSSSPEQPQNYPLKPICEVMIVIDMAIFENQKATSVNIMNLFMITVIDL